MKGNSTWDYGISTIRGPRQINEDRCFLKIMQDRKGNDFAVALVADGMGGYQAGDRASEFVVSAVQEWCETTVPQLLGTAKNGENISMDLGRVLRKVNDALFEIKRRDGITLGTTISLIFFYKGKYVVQHVGDSRIYRLDPSTPTQGSLEDTVPLNIEALQNGAIYSLTKDHSWVQNQVDQGLLTAEQARRHPRRNVLIQCLGIDKHLDPFEAFGEYGQDDLFLLCSDGFYGLFPDHWILSVVTDLYRQLGNLQSVCERLTQVAAETAEVSDNISVVLIRSSHAKNKEGSNSWKSKILSVFKP